MNFNNMARRRKETLRRNEIIADLLFEFKAFSRDEQCENLFRFLKYYSNYTYTDPRVADPISAPENDFEIEHTAENNVTK